MTMSVPRSTFEPPPPRLAGLWERVRAGRGPLTRTLRRVGSTALGTYAAYVAHGLLHPTLLRSHATAAERGEALPGDELLAAPDWVTDFAIDVAAPPAAVWPWLVQLGWGRAGWYTWYPLDNGGVASAAELVPALQTLAAGDVIPDGPRAAEGFGVWRVHALEPDRALVLRSRRDLLDGRELAAGEPDTRRAVDCSWVFALRELAPGRTRVRVRVRAHFLGATSLAVVARAMRVLFGLGDNVMENSLLEGLRARAERVR